MYSSCAELDGERDQQPRQQRGQGKIIGGRGAALDTPTARIVAVDPLSGRVHAAGKLATPRSDLAAIGLGSRILLAGGRGPAGTTAAISALVLPVRVGDRIATDGAWVRNFPLAHAYRRPGVRQIVAFRYVPRYPSLGATGLRRLRERLERFGRVPPIRAFVAELLR